MSNMPDKPDTWLLVLAWLSQHSPTIYAGGLSFVVGALRIIYGGGTRRQALLTDGVEPGVPLAQAVFDTAHVSVDPETGAPVSSQNPILGVRLVDLPNKPTNRDRVRARGDLYQISDVQPDGVAGVTIILRKA